jgi:hypothetical protein
MARPVDDGLPEEFFHTNVTLNNGTFVNPFPTPTPLRSGVWITLDNRNARVAFKPGIIGIIPNGGLLLSRNTQRLFFFPCADASLLVITTVGNNGRFTIMAG